jgi:TatD DNase family protein
VVCHVREAHAEATALLGEATSAAGGVIHSFSGGLDEARRYLDLGLYLSFSGILTFKNAEALRQAAAYAPLDRILVETDAPYLAPVPLRGRRNEPAFLPHTLQVLAEIRGVEAALLDAATEANTRRLFRF